MRGLLTLVTLSIAILACGTPIADAPPVYVCPTLPPPPTAIPYPTPYGTPYYPVWPTPYPTPFVITPPQDFYVRDAVFVGNRYAPQRIRFRVQNVRTMPASPLVILPRNIHVWQLEVANVGVEPYRIMPSLVMVLSEIILPDGRVLDAGWMASAKAGREAGIAISGDLYEIGAGETMVFDLATYTLYPASTPKRWTLQLDLEGNSGNQITWTNQINPHCWWGDVAD